MKKTLITLALVLGLAIPTAAKADGIPGPSKADAAHFGVGAVTTLAISAALPKTMNANLRTLLAFTGGVAVSMVAEAENAEAHGRDFDNGTLVSAAGGSLTALQFHF